MKRYQPWMPDEEETLIELCYTEKRIKAIARIMGRTEKSIMEKIKRMRREGYQI